MDDLQITMRDTGTLVRDPENARLHPPHQIEKLKASILRFGFINPIILGKGDVIVAGHARLEAAREMGLREVPCIEAGHLSDSDRRAYALADNRISEDGAWSMELLKANFEALQNVGYDLGGLGFRQEEIENALSFSFEFNADGMGSGNAPDGGQEEGGFAASGGGQPPAAPSASLAERFGIVPFTILDARKGWWQDRKRAWLALGIKSELGRGEQLIPNGGGQRAKQDTPTPPPASAGI